MSVVLMNVETPLMAEALSAVLHRHGDLQVVREEDSRRLTESAFLPVSSVLLMDLTAHPGYGLSERLRTCRSVRRSAPGCKLVLLVDEKGDDTVLEGVKRAKVEGEIDLFVYTSASAGFLTALIETL